MSVSADHVDWVWHSRKTGVATMVWDEEKRKYRVYIYEAFVLVSYVTTTVFKIEEVPSAIVFISDKKFPFRATAGDPYVRVVVERFDQDFEIFQKNASFV